MKTTPEETSQRRTLIVPLELITSHSPDAWKSEAFRHSAFGERFSRIRTMSFQRSLTSFIVCYIYRFDVLIYTVHRVDVNESQSKVAA